MPAPPPQPALPTWVNDRPVQQGALNAIPEHAQQLFDRTLGGFRRRKPMVKLGAAAGSVPTNDPVVVIWSTVAIDTDNMFGNTADSAVLIRTPGVYLVDGHITVQPVSGATNAAPVLVIRILVNGSNQQTDAVGVNYARFQATSGASVRVSVPVALDANSVIRVVAEQNAGVAAALDPSNGATTVGIEWIAPIPESLGGATS